MSTKKKEPTITNLGIILLLLIALTIGICGIVSSTSININSNESARTYIFGYSLTLVCIAILLSISHIRQMICRRKSEDKTIWQLLLKQVPFTNESLAILIAVSIPTIFVIWCLLLIFL